MRMSPSICRLLSLILISSTTSCEVGLEGHHRHPVHERNEDFFVRLNEVIARKEGSLCQEHNVVGGPLRGPEEVECAAYLRRTMPQRDLSILPPAYIDQNIDLALLARRSSSWAGDVPWPLFLEYVLPYATVDEARDNWRPLFWECFSPLVQAASGVSAAAGSLNKNIWGLWNITFKANQTPEIMSPFQVINAGHASCTGLSIFLVNALRSVGIPARMAGTPEWNSKGGGNHDWVEIWDPETLAWSFTGPTEWTPKGLNRTWFVPEPAQRATAGSRMHAIYAVSWERAPGTVAYPLIWTEEETVPAYDVSDYYIEASRHTDLNLATA